MKDILNLKIKRRESFRPFAPSILREAVPAWFEVDDDVPFMMQVYPIGAEKRARIPAVRHVDDAPILAILATFAAAKADVLVSGDGNLPALSDKYPLQTPAEFVRRL